MQVLVDKELNFENQTIVVIKLINRNGIEVVLTNYGATVISILVPDNLGNKKDITLGYKNINEILENHQKPEKYYFGSTIGRFANRIDKGQFTIDGTQFQLVQNEGENHLHGGHIGLNKIIWNYKISGNTIKFNHISPDGFEGYPGSLSIEISVSLNDTNEISLDYKAQTDKPTPVNLTNHCYFNLNGGESNVLNHKVFINSNYILETNKQNIPTGKLLGTNNSGFDFCNAKLLRDTKLIQNNGFDCTYVLNKQDENLEKVATISEVNNPISIEILTTEPSLQFYTANGFDGTFIGKNQKKYDKYYGICLEAQHFPDGPNHDNFPLTVLNPGKLYNQTTIYKINQGV